MRKLFGCASRLTRALPSRSRPAGSPWKATRRLLPLVCVTLTACDLAPEYELPTIAMPSMFKEDSVEAVADVAPASDGRWKRFDENAQLEEFAWWRMFEDKQLDALMEQAMKDNPSLAAAIERVNAARAVSDTRFADLLPAAELGFGPSRQLSSAAAINANLPPAAQIQTKPFTLYTARGTISYDLDLFGQNRGRVRAADADADAELANYRAARLALQAEVAQNYFRVAALRAEDAFLKQTVTARKATLDLTRKKHAAGAVDTLVLSSAEVELSAVEADAATVAQSLAVAEHALATLLGMTPSQLTLATASLAKAPPKVPAGLPASLLERRPDVKRAERQIAAANERIGVARGGYFPDISLSATGGFVSGGLSDLFRWSSRTWAIGPLAGTILTQPLFEGGRIAAARAETNANFQAAVATYREAVLTAFREVEDQLTNVRTSDSQTKNAQAGLAAAARAFEVANARFGAGYSSRLEYLDAERGLLAAKRRQLQSRGQHYIDTVQLVKALGGSWQSPPAPEKTGETPAKQ